MTPLHWAAGTESPGADLVKLLLKHGADPNAEFGERYDPFLGVPQTARMFAEKRGQTAIVETLSMQPGDVPVTYANIDRARVSLGYQPTTRIADGIARQWEWAQGKPT